MLGVQRRRRRRKLLLLRRRRGAAAVAIVSGSKLCGEVERLLAQRLGALLDLVHVGEVGLAHEGRKRTRNRHKVDSRLREGYAPMWIFTVELLQRFDEQVRETRRRSDAYELVLLVMDA